MIKCETDCPRNEFEGCCFICPEKEDCPDACREEPDFCESSTVIANDEADALATFQKSQLETLSAVADLISRKKALEDQEKDLKKALYEAMEKYGIKKFESDVLNLTLVLPTTAVSVDSAKLKRKYPDIAAECSKTTSKAGYVKITLKAGDADGR